MVTGELNEAAAWLEDLQLDAGRTRRKRTELETESEAPEDLDEAMAGLKD